MPRTAVVVIGDLHTNSTLGLPSSPSINLDDGGSYVPSISQMWLLQCWEQYWAWVDELCKRERVKRRIMVMLGEGSDGDHHGTAQIITRNPATMLRMAVDVLEPRLKRIDKWYMIRGTPAHSGESSWMDEAIARDLGAEPDSANGTHSHYTALIEVEGVRFNLAHHINIGSRPHTAHNAVNALATDLIYQYADYPHLLPHVALRGHTHGYQDSGTARPVRVFNNPGWQLPTGFVHRIAAGLRARAVGGMAIVCDNGRYEQHAKLFEVKPREYTVV